MQIKGVESYIHYNVTSCSTGILMYWYYFCVIGQQISFAVSLHQVILCVCLCVTESQAHLLSFVSAFSNLQSTCTFW